MRASAGLRQPHQASVPHTLRLSAPRRGSFFCPTHLQGVTRTSPVVARYDHRRVRGTENVWVGGHCGWEAIATATLRAEPLTEPPPAGLRDAGCSARGSSFDLQLLPLAGLPGKWVFFPRSKGTCFCLAWIRVPAFFPSWHLGSCPLVLKLPFLYPRLGQSRGKNRGSSCSSKTCPSRGRSACWAGCECPEGACGESECPGHSHALLRPLLSLQLRPLPVPPSCFASEKVFIDPES